MVAQKLLQTVSNVETLELCWQMTGKEESLLKMDVGYCTCLIEGTERV